ncbi:hypothetical protein P88_00250 [Erwinia phage phiEt88]|uniref:hypothetical protein n=1 Tax=Erwinia phage phiEt88 TaxID=925984 RepID=UPI0001F1FC69|nr:hypothetical protein ErPhphiEt88_gp25 [Erwinia phage phiEt88]CBX44536.1 hypothetical protein P88_00250 [Erwinia phage phiEt88]
MSDWLDIDLSELIEKRPTDWLDKGGQVGRLFSAVGTLNPGIEARYKYIYQTQSIYNAHGIELDRFGEYVGVLRDGMSDDKYRREIMQAKLATSFSGAPDNVIYVTSTITEATSVELVEVFPASFMVHTDGLQVPVNINEIIDNAAIGGVRAYCTHDYGLNGFSLAGIDVESGQALQVGANTAMQAGDNEALGLNRGSVFISGSYLDAAGAISGVLSVNGSYLGIADDDYLLIFSRDYGVTGTMLCGAMPK